MVTNLYLYVSIKDMSSTASWNSVWTGMKDLDFERENYTWTVYESLLGKRHDYKGKRVIEIGCGTGISTCIMAKRGAKVTFLDYSKDALKIVKKIMDGFGVDGELIHGDAFETDLGKNYDISHSEGVIEHFKNKRRQEIVDIHSNVLKRGGKSVITIPYSRCAPYRIGKKLAEMTGTWIHGNEYPYSKTELRKRMGMSGLSVDRVIGGEFMFSFGWLLTPLWVNSRILSMSIGKPRNEWLSKFNYDNPLANKFGRVIAAVGTKE